MTLLAVPDTWSARTTLVVSGHSFPPNKRGGGQWAHAEQCLSAITAGGLSLAAALGRGRCDWPTATKIRSAGFNGRIRSLVSSEA